MKKILSFIDFLGSITLKVCSSKKLGT